MPRGSQLRLLAGKREPCLPGCERLGVVRAVLSCIEQIDYAELWKRAAEIPHEWFEHEQCDNQWTQGRTKTKTLGGSEAADFRSGKTEMGRSQEGQEKHSLIGAPC